MMKPKCPRCGSTRIDEYMSFYGPMVCLDCGFRVEDKTARPNPFLEAAQEAAAQEDQEQVSPRPSLGAALYEVKKAQQKKRDADPPE
ncbi:MAG: hypothetical protein ACK2UY_13675 [Anaerolineae bacterium]|jgi:transcription initiation factor TFIIIB Brf1 subunit/transcription initiation factor TFIIB